MSPRTLFTAILVTALPFAAVACGDDEPEDATDSTTTTVKDQDEATTAPDGTDDDTAVTTDTTEASDTDLPFADGLTEARSRLEAATSICDLADLSDYVDEVGQPEGPEQVQSAVEFQSDLWRAIADSAPEEFAAQAEVIRGVAERFPVEAEGVGYDFEAIGELDSINSTEFSDALGAFYQATVETC